MVCYELFTCEPLFARSHTEVMRSVLDEPPAALSSVGTMLSELDEALSSAL